MSTLPTQRADAQKTGAPTQSIFDLTRANLEQVVEEMGERAYRTKQIWRGLYKDGASSFDDITTLPMPLREKLASRFRLDPLKPVIRRRSRDRLVEKFLFELADGELIETVLMRYEATATGRARSTVCISTQAGCALGCTFCATGQQGFRRNLTAGEIATQVVFMNTKLASEAREGDHPAVTNVVFMGMGEPLANYRNTLAAVEILNDEEGVRLGARHMTISTVGLVPQILQLADEPFQINLAISLHAPSDKVRDKTMPINQRYPINHLIKACRTYIAKTNRRVSFEYVLLAGENDRPEHAEELAELLRDMLCHVNLIPVNATDAPYLRPDNGRIGKFRDILQKASITTTVRFEKGTDIDAGCGQLRARALAATE